MSNPWPTTDDEVHRLCVEATNVAQRLGHKLILPFMVGFDGTLRACCVVCCELALVRPRRFRLAPVSGVAATMHCRASR